MKKLAGTAHAIFLLFVFVFWPLLLILLISAMMSVTGTTAGMSVTNTPLNWKVAFGVGAVWNAVYFLVGYQIVRKGLATPERHK